MDDFFDYFASMHADNLRRRGATDQMTPGGRMWRLPGCKGLVVEAEAMEWLRVREVQEAQVSQAKPDRTQP